MSEHAFRFGVHEFSHADEAARAGLSVPSARIGRCGGVTDVRFDVDTDLRVLLLVVLAGTAGELAVFGDADPRWALVDLTNAFRLAYDIATDEEHAHDDLDTTADLRKLAALTDAQKAQGVARLVARRGPRAHEIVAAAQAEALRRCVARLVALRHGAGALSRHAQHVDTEALVALVEEGTRMQREDDRRWRETA